MLIEQVRPGIFRVTVSGYQLAALTSAARWVVDGVKGELSAEAFSQLEQVLKDYDKATLRLQEERQNSVRKVGEQ